MMAILHLHRHHDSCQRRRYRCFFVVVDVYVIHFRSLQGLVVSPILQSNYWCKRFAAAALTILLRLYLSLVLFLFVQKLSPILILSNRKRDPNDVPKLGTAHQHISGSAR